MKIKKQEGTVNLLMKVNNSDEFWDECSMAYVEFTKEELMKLLVLRNTQEDLSKTHGVLYLPLDARISWIEGVPDELEELNEALPDEEYFTVTQIPEKFLYSNEVRVEGTESNISEFGVSYKANTRYSNIEVSTWSISWEMITQLLKNCDPQSVRFIKDDESK